MIRHPDIRFAASIAARSARVAGVLLVTAAPDEDGEAGDLGFGGEGGEGNDLYDRAVAVVTRDGKASTSYIQRRLQIGYNRAASLMERMEKEGIVGQPNHAGKREILVGGDDDERF